MFTHKCKLTCSVTSSASLHWWHHLEPETSEVIATRSCLDVHPPDSPHSWDSCADVSPAEQQQSKSSKLKFKPIKSIFYKSNVVCQWTELSCYSLASICTAWKHRTLAKKHKYQPSVMSQTALIHLQVSPARYSFWFLLHFKQLNVSLVAENKNSVFFRVFFFFSFAAAAADCKNRTK